MRALKHAPASIALLALLLVTTLAVSPGTQAAAATMSIETLTRAAADSLRAEYHVLITGGVPPLGR